MKIYSAKINDICEKNLHELSMFIDSDKRYRINNFIIKKDKIRTLIGEIMIRNIIIEKLGVKNRDIVFCKNQYGKPYLKGYPGFNFNISHSGDFVVCAIDDKPIGIDVEEVKHIEYEEIARSFFSVSEFNYIIKQDSNIQLSKFYEIWTLKESFIKCCGQGLSMPLRVFSIHVDEYENIKIMINNQHEEYVFKKIDIAPGYKMAICCFNKEIPNNAIEINQNKLIENYFRYNL